MSETDKNKTGGMSVAVNAGLGKAIAQEHGAQTVMVMDVGGSYKQLVAELTKGGGEAIVANVNSRILLKK